MCVSRHWTVFPQGKGQILPFIVLALVSGPTPTIQNVF